MHVCPVMSDSLRPHWAIALQAPLSMGFFPGKSIGVGHHFLFQGIFLTQRSNLNLLHWGRQVAYHYAVLKKER